MRTNEALHFYYYGLITGLLAVFVISPFLGHGTVASSLFSVALLITLVFSTLAISRSKRIMALAIILAIPLVVSVVQFTITHHALINPLVTALFGIGFVFLIIMVLMRDIFTSTKVDTPLLVGASSLYLLLSLMWGFIYLALEHSNPGSFYLDLDLSQAVDPKDYINMFMYYSMVTLTTLGYGDIVPLSPPARAMSTLEAAIGQLYLTVLVARLVGMHIAQHHLWKK